MFAATYIAYHLERHWMKRCVTFGRTVRQNRCRASEELAHVAIGAGIGTTPDRKLARLSWLIQPNARRL